MNNKFNGVLRKNSANSRYFTDDSGRAVYLTGSHTWATMQDIWFDNQPRRNMEYDAFLEMLSDYGHNFLRFWQWIHPKNVAWSGGDIPIRFDPQPYERSGPGVANDGLPKFDLTKWNEDYFARLRDRVQKAGERGIYVSVMMFEGWGIKYATKPENDPWTSYEFNPANNINGITDNPVLDNGKAWDVFSLNCPQLLYWQKEYVKKIIDTVNDLDNVLYEICNEVPYRKEAMDWMSHLCAFIHEYEGSKPKQHPVGITAEGGDHRNEELFAMNSDWISPSNGKLFEYRYNPPAADGRKVILSDTDHLWGHGGEVAWIWKSFTRGMNVIFMDPWEPVPMVDEPDWMKDAGTSRNQRYYHAWDPIRRNMGYARRYALRMDLNRCMPRNELCTSTYCLTNPGVEYLCYLAEGGEQGLDMYEAEGTFMVEWMNPFTGITTKAKELPGGNRLVICAPFAGPAVFYACKSE